MFQAFLTFVIGVPHPRQSPLLSKSPRLCLIGSFAVLVQSVCGGAAAVLVAASPVASPARVGAAVAALACVIVSSGAFRAMHNFVLHHASHGDFGRHDWLIGELAGVVGMTQSFADYRKDHRLHHASLISEDDPDQRTLGRLGIIPGLPRNEYPWRLVRALTSPHLFLSTVTERVSHSVAPLRRPVRTACFACLQASLLLPAVWLSLRWGRPGPLIAWGFSWLLPLTVGHHISMVLYAVGLHAWYKRSDEPGWAGYAEKTGARFFADPTPEASPWRHPVMFGP
ncbi:fatty acid desaturase [Streptomyces sp. SD15]